MESCLAGNPLTQHIIAHINAVSCIVLLLPQIIFSFFFNFASDFFLQKLLVTAGLIDLINNNCHYNIITQQMYFGSFLPINEARMKQFSTTQKTITKIKTKYLFSIHLESEIWWSVKTDHPFIYCKICAHSALKRARKSDPHV